METAPNSSWRVLPDEMQAELARHAMRRAALIFADQAELFSAQFACGVLLDKGAPDALRLFAAMMRETTADDFATIGSA